MFRHWLSEDILWRFIAFAWGQFSWSSTSGQFSEKCQNTFSAGWLHTCLGSTELTQLSVLCLWHKAFCSLDKVVFFVPFHSAIWVVTKWHCRWRRQKVLVKKRWSWSITSSITGADCTGIGDRSATVEKNQPALFDHCLRQNTCKARWTGLSVCPYLFQRRVPQTTKVPSAHPGLAPCLES